jgi:murein DD-endopeptidase MepM/ murein hydrolase activator NlpD
MIRNVRVQIGVAILVLASLAGVSSYTLNAKDDAVKVKDQLDAKNQRIKEIKAAADKYRAEIAKMEEQQTTLMNEVSLLENKAAATELDISALNQEVEATISDIALLEGQIGLKTTDMVKKKTLVAELVRNIRETDGTSTLEMLLNNDTFSDFFDRIERMRNIEERTYEAVKELKGLREDLIVRKQKTDEKRVALDTQRAQLVSLKGRLEDEQIAKNQLMQDAAMSEQKFQAMLYDVKQDEAATEAQAKQLEVSLKKVLDSKNDRPGQGAILTYPINSRVFTTLFHDPTYPFRKLFEHTGIDLATPKGTPIKAAAPGYVASVKLGRQYGNYITIIHAGGISTLYAHLSRTVAKADTYVERGEIIGYSGGVPGDQGAGMSTGAHLHFESRVNGVPANPLNFLLETK